MARHKSQLENYGKCYIEDFRSANGKGIVFNSDFEIAIQELPTFEELYAFVKRHYKASKFTARDKVVFYGESYSRDVTASYMATLASKGMATICHHESASGVEVVFDCGLNQLNTHSAITEYKRNHGTLSHIF